MDTYLEFLAVASMRIRDLIDSYYKGRDASAKERRQYPSTPDGAVRDRIRATTPRLSDSIGHPRKRTRGGRPDMVFSSSHVPSSHLFSQIYHRFYLAVSRSHERPLKIKIGPNLRITSDSGAMESAAVVVRRHCRRIMGRANMQHCSYQLSTLLGELEADVRTLTPPGRYQTAELLDGWKDIAVAGDVNYECSEGYQLLLLLSDVTPTLHMKERVYASRGDYRAFITDSLGPRLLVASIFEKLLKNDRPTHANTWDHTCQEIFPTKSSGSINWCLALSPSTFTLVFVLDISSFTASCPSWALTLSMHSEFQGLPSGHSLNDTVMVDIEGYIFETTMKEVMETYLIYTLGAPALDESTGERFVAKGGYLGVGANMQVSKLYLTLLIRDEIEIARGLGVHLRIQSSGDDTFGAIAGHESSVEQTYSSIQRRLRMGVGHIKEATEMRYRGWEKIDAACLVFCKHRIGDMVIERPGGGWLKLWTFANPSLTEEERVLNLGPRSDERTKLHRSSLLGWRRDSEECDQPLHYYWARQVCYDDVHGRGCAEFRDRGERLLTTASGALIFELVIALPIALILMSQVVEVLTTKGYIRTLPLDKLWYLVRINRLEVTFNVRMGDLHYTVFHARAESRKITQGQQGPPMPFIDPGNSVELEEFGKCLRLSIDKLGSV